MRTHVHAGPGRSYTHTVIKSGHAGTPTRAWIARRRVPENAAESHRLNASGHCGFTDSRPARGQWR